MDAPASYDLTGKVAVVTGAARGIGLAVATLLRERGAQVVASDRSPGVDGLASADIATYVGDVGVEADARATMELAVERFGRLDVLVNNAGRTFNAPLVDTSVEDWDTIMSTNARGNFLQAREAVKVMLAQGEGGAIVSVASISSVIAFPSQSAYAASKGALLQLARVIAVEHGQQGIRSNAVLPVS